MYTKQVSNPTGSVQSEYIILNIIIGCNEVNAILAQISAIRAEVFVTLLSPSNQMLWLCPGVRNVATASYHIIHK
jgi:hypothetical protein